jgi:hypothetical protein
VPDFETYIRGARPEKPPTVTITAAGMVVLSLSAYESLGRPAGVVFLIDRDERLIGFRPAVRGEKAAFSVSDTRNVSGRSVLREMDVDYGTSQRYPLLTDDGTPHIDLKQPGTPVTSNRRKK